MVMVDLSVVLHVALARILFIYYFLYILFFPNMKDTARKTVFFDCFVSLKVY